MHYLQWKFSYFIDICSVPKGSVDNKSALVQWLARRQTGDKPLPKSMLTQFTDASTGDNELHTEQFTNDIKSVQMIITLYSVFSNNDYYSFMFITYQMYKISQFKTFLQGKLAKYIGPLEFNYLIIHKDTYHIFVLSTHNISPKVKLPNRREIYLLNRTAFCDLIRNCNYLSRQRIDEASLYCWFKHIVNLTRFIQIHY